MTEVEVIENVPVNEEKEEKNTVGLVGMILSIIGLVLLITIIGAGLGLFLLCLGFILGVIGLFSKPRGKAWVAVIIPLIIAILMGSGIYYVWNSVKAPANEFTTWLEAQNEAKRFDGVDGDIFQQIASQEFNALVNQLTGDDFALLYDAATGDNALEKGAYMFFNYFQQGLENSLEKYNAYMSGDYTLEDLSLDADAAKIFSINVEVNEDAAESVSEPEVAEADVIFNDDTEAENIDNIIDEVGEDLNEIVNTEE